MMSIEFEDHLRRQMKTELAQWSLAPGAVEAVRQRGQRRARRRRAALVGGAGALVVAAGSVAGYTVWDGKADGSPNVVATNAETGLSGSTPPLNVITRTAQDSDVGSLARISGTLIVTENGCLAVAVSGNEQRAPIAWGHGWSARWEDDTVVVLDAEGNVFARTGEEISLSGGWSTALGHNSCTAGSMWWANADQAPEPEQS